MGSEMCIRDRTRPLNALMFCAAFAFVGALIMGVLNNGMSLLGVSMDCQSAIKGLVVLVAVAFDMYFKNRQHASV